MPHDSLPPSHPTRRSFLQTTAAAAATIAATSVAASALAAPATTTAATAPASQPKKLNLAMIGLGGQGSWHLDIVKGIDRANIIALCDVDTRQLVNAARKVTAAEVFVDFRDVLKMKDLDAVLIATPDHTHAAITAAALHA